MDHTGLLYVIGFAFAATIFVFGTILFSWLITHRRRRPAEGPALRVRDRHHR